MVSLLFKNITFLKNLINKMKADLEIENMALGGLAKAFES